MWLYLLKPNNVSSVFHYGWEPALCFLLKAIQHKCWTHKQRQKTLDVSVIQHIWSGTRVSPQHLQQLVGPGLDFCQTAKGWDASEDIWARGRVTKLYKTYKYTAHNSSNKQVLSVPWCSHSVYLLMYIHWPIYRSYQGCRQEGNSGAVVPAPGSWEGQEKAPYLLWMAFGCHLVLGTSNFGGPGSSAYKNVANVIFDTVRCDLK